MRIRIQKAIQIIVDRYGFKYLGKLGAIIQKINGNSHSSSNVQWLYQILDTVKQMTHKHGITGVKPNSSGKLTRLQNQLNSLNKGQSGRYQGRILDKIDHGRTGARGEIRQLEKELNEEYLRLNGKLPDGNAIP